jgi:hypothetical protein
MRVLRIGLALVLGVLTAGLSAGVAAAARPSVEFLPPPDGLLDSSCGYEILVTFPVQKEYLRTFFDRDGNVVKIIVTGNLVVTFTNTATGASLTSNISGPFHTNVIQESNTSEGRVGGPLPGLPGLNLFAGRIDYDSGRMVGHLEGSVCEMLAP